MIQLNEMKTPKRKQPTTSLTKYADNSIYGVCISQIIAIVPSESSRPYDQVKALLTYGHSIYLDRAWVEDNKELIFLEKD